jgi:hypothetical protein
MATVQPSRTRKFVDGNGLLTLEGWLLVRALWERTGGLEDTITNGTLVSQSGPVGLVSAASGGPDAGGPVALPGDALTGGDPVAAMAETMNLEPV